MAMRLHTAVVAEKLHGISRMKRRETTRRPAHGNAEKRGGKGEPDIRYKGAHQLAARGAIGLEHHGIVDGPEPAASAPASTSTRSGGQDMAPRIAASIFDRRSVMTASASLTAQRSPRDRREPCVSVFPRRRPASRR